MSTTRSSAEFAALIAKLSAFVKNEVIPTEDLRKAHDAYAVEESVQALRQRAMAQLLPVSVPAVIKDMAGKVV
jgi:hypothetical protein